MDSLITEKRNEFHAGLVSGGLLTLDQSGTASNADKGNKTSIAIARHMAEALQVRTTQERAAGQTLGGDFEKATARLVDDTFPHFRMLRPGAWEVLTVGNSRSKSVLSAYEPYLHLAELDEAIRTTPGLLAVLGNAYAISPDVIVIRKPVPDTAINGVRASGDGNRASEGPGLLVDDQTARHTPIRSRNQAAPILHAVISCKWTLRSDRAQNARSEALNLVRNRKGRLPHVVVVTGEPLPSRLASLALGTGDIDCVYHIALPELQTAVSEIGNDDTKESLRYMVEGRRLKDISDLPLDLTV